jgi:hypothetical protein
MFSPARAQPLRVDLVDIDVDLVRAKKAGVVGHLLDQARAQLGAGREPY